MVEKNVARYRGKGKLGDKLAVWETTGHQGAVEARTTLVGLQVAVAEGLAVLILVVEFCADGERGPGAKQAPGVPGYLEGRFRDPGAPLASLVTDRNARNGA